MDSTDNRSVSIGTEQLLAIIGAKEVELHVLKAQLAMLTKRLTDLEACHSQESSTQRPTS